VSSSPSSRREELTRIALALLEAEGPEAVSTRKVAAAYGASTMVVYSEFGSLDGLVASVVEHGFGLLRAELDALGATDDAVTDLCRIATTYVGFAEARPDLYRVIYAVSPLAGRRQTGVQLLLGSDAFEVLHEAVRRAYRAGRLTRATPYTAAVEAWISLHGLALARLSGYLDEMPPVEGGPLALLRTLLLGFGDAPERVAASLPPGA